MLENSKSRLARRFLDALCGGDSDTVGALITDDFIYTDGRGNQIEGRAACVAAAKAFHAMEPDYRFAVRDAVVRGDTVMLRGVSTATHPALRGEALLSGRVRGGKLGEWRVDRHRSPPLAKILTSKPSDPA